MEWQAIPIVPFVDLEFIKKFSKDAKKLLSYEEIERNSFGFSTIFYNNRRILDVYKKKYFRRSNNMSVGEYIGRVFTPLQVDFIGDKVSRNGFSYLSRVISFVLIRE